MKPAPFSAFTTPEFWDDDHISAQMLAAHLDPDSCAASRTHEFIARSAAWMASALPLGPASSVLDLGCGPGLYSCLLARAGVTVRGIDVSRRSIAHASAVARAEGLPAAFVVGSYLEGELGGPYDAALLIYEDYCVLSPQQRAGLLARTRAALRPGGALVMDVTAASRFDREQPCVEQAANLDDGFWAESPYEGVHERFTYPDERLVLDRFTITKDGTQRQFWNWMQCLTPEQATAELTAAGFGLAGVWGDVAGAPFDAAAESFAVIARRPAVADPQWAP